MNHSLHQQATQEFLDAARELTAQDEHQEALTYLSAALELTPQHREVLALSVAIAQHLGQEGLGAQRLVGLIALLGEDQALDELQRAISSLSPSELTTPVEERPAHVWDTTTHPYLIAFAELTITPPDAYLPELCLQGFISLEPRHPVQVVSDLMLQGLLIEDLDGGRAFILAADIFGSLSAPRERKSGIMS